MTMSIQENVLEVMDEIERERAEFQPTGTVGPIATDLKAKAIAAIMGGATHWIAYMNLFSKGPAELARLIPTDGTENNPDKREARAYLVANAVCAPGTTTRLIETVFDRLD
jgi:hypothetical protein